MVGKYLLHAGGVTRSAGVEAVLRAQAGPAATC